MHGEMGNEVQKTHQCGQLNDWGSATSFMLPWYLSSTIPQSHFVNDECNSPSVPAARRFLATRVQKVHQVLLRGFGMGWGEKH